MLIDLIKSIYFKNRLFFITGIIIFLYILGSFYPFYYVFAQLFSLTLLISVALEIYFLYSNKNGTGAYRDTPERFSNGDNNTIYLHIKNNYNYQSFLEIIDEVPYQFQARDKKFRTTIKSFSTKTISYKLRPTERGEYHFGGINIYASTWLKLIQKRYTIKANSMVPVYPSYLQVKKYKFLAISNQLHESGIKPIRKIGHNYEFDQIREYVEGDDYRSINWKATAKTNHLMVNQYQDEKSQHVYCIINMGRVMKMPFNNLTLLDHAINSTLVMLNTAFIKDDRPGLLSFSNNINSYLPAERKKGQMNRILETLYNQKTNFLESDYEKLYFNIRHILKQRSLIFLYTNFEGMVSLKREINSLRGISKHHLLIVVFFKNTELYTLVNSTSKSLEDIYIKTIAKKFQHEKELIVRELRKNGIDSILTDPKHLTVDSINKYLEIKAKRLI